MSENLEKLKNMKPVETEEEYWEAHKIFKKEITSLTKMIKEFYKNPRKYLDEFDEALAEAIRIGIIQESYAYEVKEKISKAMSDPYEFKEWIKRKPHDFKKWLKGNRKDKDKK